MWKALGGRRVALESFIVIRRPCENLCVKYLASHCHSSLLTATLWGSAVRPSCLFLELSLFVASLCP